MQVQVRVYLAEGHGSLPPQQQAVQQDGCPSFVTRKKTVDLEVYDIIN